MYETSNKYKSERYSRDDYILNVYIEDKPIEDVLNFRVSHNFLNSDKIELGSTPSKVVEFDIEKSLLPEIYNNFYIETGLDIDGEDEIVPIGFFILEEINQDDDMVSLRITDYMMNFERVIDISKILPCTASQLLQYLCDSCGVENGSSSFINSDTIITTYDSSLTARQYIGYIAELAGGFAFIGRDGRLYIKNIGENKNNIITVQDVNEMTVKQFNELLLKGFEKIDEEIDIDLFGDYQWGEEFVCNEVDYNDEQQSYEISDTDYSSAFLDCILDSDLYDNEIKGRAIELNSNNLFINSKSQVQKIYNKLKSLRSYSFEGSSIIDPATDIGDIVYIDNKPVIYQGDMEYLGYFKGTITSKIETEQKKTTTIGSALSYASQMRNMKKNYNVEIQDLVEQVNLKANKDDLIQQINESKTNEDTDNIEDNKINSEKININGAKSKNNQFSIDENTGEMSCNNAIINNSSITNDGKELIGDNGVLTNIHILGKAVHSNLLINNYGDFSLLGFEYDENNEDKSIANCIIIYPILPENFTILSAIIILKHYPIKIAENWGYARKLKLYKRDTTNNYNNYDISKGIILEELEDQEIESGLGEDGYTPSIPTEETHILEEITSIDISNEIKNNIAFIIKSADTKPEATEMEESDKENCLLKSGMVLATLDIKGYLI